MWRDLLVIFMMVMSIILFFITLDVKRPNYKYKIDVPKGHYFTDSYYKENGCLYFLEGSTRHEVCGSYTIVELR